MASALNATAGQAIRATARSAWVSACTSGWFWQLVPSRFHSERDRVQPEHLDAEVGQEQDDVGELARRPRGCDQSRSHCQALNVVQTQPCEVLVPGEVARGEVREDLRQGALVGVGQLAVGEDVEVVAVVLARPPARRLRPLVLAGDVVEHEVEHQADAVLAQRRSARSRRSSTVPRSARTVAVVRHRVPAVVVARPRLQQRHQVQVGDAELAQVGQAAPDAREVVGEPVGVRGVADMDGDWNQSGSSDPCEVEAPQLRIPLPYAAAASRASRAARSSASSP